MLAAYQVSSRPTVARSKPPALPSAGLCCTSHTRNAIELLYKVGNVTAAGWQVTLCDPMWHVSSRSGVATLRTAIHLLLTYLLLYSHKLQLQKQEIKKTKEKERLLQSRMPFVPPNSVKALKANLSDGVGYAKYILQTSVGFIMTTTH